MNLKRLMSLIIITIFVQNVLHACDCRDVIGTDKSTLVFKGKVTKVKQVSGSSEYAITFKVRKKYKGIVKEKSITIYTPCFSEGCCGIPFQKGDVYLVVTREILDKLYSDACTTTFKIR